MRLFFALHPPAGTRFSLVRLQQQLIADNGRHTHSQDLHMTLQFLGSVDAEKLHHVETAARAVKASGFTLEIDRIDYWSRSKVVWAGPSKAPDALNKLVNCLGAELGKYGFDPAPEPYRPHVTLARKARPLAPVNCESIHWKVEQMVLFEAVAGHRPNRYRPVTKIKLENE